MLLRNGRPGGGLASRATRAAVAAVAFGALASVLLAGCQSSGGDVRRPARTDLPPPPPPPPPVEVLADGITFLPPVLSTAEQLRPSLAVAGADLFFTDSSETPLTKLSLSTGARTPLASRMGVPGLVAVDGGRIVWTVDTRLMETSLATGVTRVLEGGNLDPSTGLLVEPSAAYWVKTADELQCSPPCSRHVERVDATGSVSLAQATRRIASIAQDGAYVYWEEDSNEPMLPGCDCGSTVRKVPKSGGPATVLVDGLLNGLIPPPGPGFIPGSWFPVGGIATDGAHVYFADVSSGTGSYRIMRVPVAGGTLEVLAEIPGPDAGDRPHAPRKLAVDGANVYWIDASALNAIPLTGGTPAAVVSGLASPADLVLADAGAFVVEQAAAAGAGAIRRVPFDGSGATVAVAGLDWPVAFGLDASRFYWTEWWRVGSAPRAGGASTTLASGIQTHLPRILVAGDGVLVADGPFMKRVPVAGGPAEKVVAAKDELGGPLLAYAEDFVTDGQKVYLGFRGLGAVGSSVYGLPLDGSPAVRFTPSGFSLSPDCLTRVAVDAASVYWISGSTSLPLGCVIEKAPIGGGEGVALVDLPIFDFALDGANLYFTESRIVVVDGSGTHFIGAESVNRISVNGGSTTMWPQPGFPFVTAVDARYVYWIDAVGALAWMRKDGTGWSSVGTGPLEETALYADALVADGTSVYWTNTLLGTISRVTVP
jgi:hypothetical protein